jgi:hypothetical protein
MEDKPRTNDDVYKEWTEYIKQRNKHYPNKEQSAIAA